MANNLRVVMYLLLGFGVCWVGKRTYGLFHRRARVDQEVSARDNVAFAVPLGAYYLGILIVLGGPLSGQARAGVVQDALSVIGWGLLGVVLLNLASLAEDRLLVPRLDLFDEVLGRRNLAAGIVLASFHLSSALLVLGALSEEGGLLPAAVFWAYAQVLLMLAAGAFLRVVRYDVAAEIERGNQAVALSLGGVLVGMGNVLRMAITGSFEGWSAGFAAATGYALAGLALLFVARWLLDWLLLPGVTIRHEVVEQEVPNVGVGYLEALFYLGASFLIGWSL